MKPSSQRAKFKNHEREVGAAFTEAYYPNGDGEFRRTLAIQAAGMKQFYPGDLVPLLTAGTTAVIDKTFPFLLECKCWDKKNVNFIFSGLYAQPSKIYDWMEQAINDAIGSTLAPMVIFKFWKKNCAMLQYREFNRLRAFFGRYPGEYYIIRCFQSQNITEDVCIGLLDDFLDWIDWDFYRLSKEARRLRSFIEREKTDEKDS